MFEVRSIVKHYGKQRVLGGSLSGGSLSLSFQPGMLVALLGRNGSGKSTLMRLLAQQDVFEEGDILFEGTSLTSADLELNRRLVFVSEDHTLPLQDTVGKWAEHFSQMAKHYDFILFEKLAAALGVDTSKTFSELSRGQKMKALFVLQAPKKPDVYLLDEITSVLDSGSRLAMMQFLKSEQQRGCLIIASTNIATEMQLFATHFCFLGKEGLQLFCATSDFDTHFKKVRYVASPNINTDEIAARAGARKAHLNSDGSWSYLIQVDRLGQAGSFSGDRRQITIEDVASYFSTEDN